MNICFLPVLHFVGECCSTNYKYKDVGKTDSFLVRRDQETDYHVANCLVGNEWMARMGGMHQNSGWKVEGCSASTEQNDNNNIKPHHKTYDFFKSSLRGQCSA